MSLARGESLTEYNTPCLPANTQCKDITMQHQCKLSQTGEWHTLLINVGEGAEITERTPIIPGQCLNLSMRVIQIWCFNFEFSVLHLGHVANHFCMEHVMYITSVKVSKCIYFLF